MFSSALHQPHDEFRGQFHALALKIHARSTVGQARQHVVVRHFQTHLVENGQRRLVDAGDL